ncbi:MAG: glycosyl amidation-associated protein WbuZ [Candidatus Komeilibacteria bacterium]|nr:glycosyl amidation-associated protein WbuZ [Candidatus Komeilibacteria bacterium]
MVKKRIIPCLLFKNGRCVKGVNFSNHRDVGHPVTNAKVYDAQGADELIFLDITASAEEHEILLEMVKEMADECFMPLAVGGGVKTIKDIQNLLRAGADKIAINTAAVENPDFITQAAKKFGKQCIIVSIDYKKNIAGQNEVFTHSGTKPTGLEPVAWAKQVWQLGAGEILLTNIDKEGTRTGYDFEVLKTVAEMVDIPVIPNGGAGSMTDLKTAFTQAGASAVALGSILHFTDQSVIKARNYLITQGVDVRTEANYI